MLKLFGCGLCALAMTIGVLAAGPAAAQAFTSENGEVVIGDFSNWEVREQSMLDDKNRLILKMHTKSGPYTSVNISINDIGAIDVFDPATMQRYIDALRKSNSIITVKPVLWDGRKYQSIFMTRLTVDDTDKPFVVFVQELMVTHNGRFHNITIASVRDQPETNPALVQLFSDMTIK